MWKRPAAPGDAEKCVELARKDAIARVRAKAVDALWPEARDAEGWRNLMLDILGELRGL